MRFLDTNVLAKLAHPEQKDEVLPYLRDQTDETWVTSSVVVFEFFRPAARRQRVVAVQTWLGRVLDGIEPFEESAGLAAAKAEASLADQGASLRMRDLLIAAHARDVGATLVTFDKGDFQNRSVQQLFDVDVIVTESETS